MRGSESRPRRQCDRAELGFTLVELLVVIAILAILGGLSLTALRGASGRGKADSTRNVIGTLSDAILEQYESYEDGAVAIANTANGVIAMRQRIRQEMPASWEEVAPGTVVTTATTAMGRAYSSYKTAVKPSTAYASAECLYMILTQSGQFPDFLENFSSRFVGDIDKDGAFEFWDGWGRPIFFLRWAPGAMPLTRRNATLYHDPLDPYALDASAYALVPLIFSAGPDEALNDPMSGASGYGILSAAETGWPDAGLGTVSTATAVSGTTPCTYNPANNGLIGAADPGNPDASRDNVSNYQKLFE
jgi:prepilin-type N-terminal cleavage/methylation domain-containing protein